MGTLALGVSLASWEPWVRLATQGPRESAERRVTRERWGAGTLGCQGPRGSQDSLAGPARQSTARMELEGPQGLREKQAGQACQAPWGCQASVSLQPALEPQPMPPHASRNLDPSKGHEHEARIEPGGHPGGKGLGSLWVDMHPSPQTRKPASPGPSILDPGVLRKRKF